MNKNYGKLVAGEVEYAPAKITKDDIIAQGLSSFN